MLFEENGIEHTPERMLLHLTIGRVRAKYLEKKMEIIAIEDFFDCQNPNNDSNLAFFAMLKRMLILTKVIACATWVEIT